MIVIVSVGVTHSVRPVYKFTRMNRYFFGCVQRKAAVERELPEQPHVLRSGEKVAPVGRDADEVRIACDNLPHLLYHHPCSIFCLFFKRR